MQGIWDTIKDKKPQAEITEWTNSASNGTIYDDALLKAGVKRTDTKWKTKRNAIKGKFLVAININKQETYENSHEFLLKAAFKAVEAFSPIVISVISTLNKTTPSTLYHILSAIEGKHMNLALEKCNDHGIEMCLRLHDALYVLEEDRDAALTFISDSFYEITTLNCTAN